MTLPVAVTTRSRPLASTFASTYVSVAAHTRSPEKATRAQNVTSARAVSTSFDSAEDIRADRAEDIKPQFYRYRRARIKSPDQRTSRICSVSDGSVLALSADSH